MGEFVAGLLHPPCCSVDILADENEPHADTFASLSAFGEVVLGQVEVDVAVVQLQAEHHTLVLPFPDDLESERLLVEITAGLQVAGGERGEDLAVHR